MAGQGPLTIEEDRCTAAPHSLTRTWGRHPERRHWHASRHAWHASPHHLLRVLGVELALRHALPLCTRYDELVRDALHAVNLDVDRVPAFSGVGDLVEGLLVHLLRVNGKRSDGRHLLVAERALKVLRLLVLNKCDLIVELCRAGGRGEGTEERLIDAVGGRSVRVD